MKITSKSTVFLIFCFFGLSTIQAQRWGGTPEENAQAQTERMTDSLTLSSAQTTKVLQINLKYANLMADTRTKSRESEDFDRNTMRESMKKLREEQSSELKLVLTSEQFGKFEKMQNERRERREKGRKRGDGKKKGKENRS